MDAQDAAAAAAVRRLPLARPVASTRTSRGSACPTTGSSARRTRSTTTLFAGDAAPYRAPRREPRRGGGSASRLMPSSRCSSASWSERSVRSISFARRRARRPGVSVLVAGSGPARRARCAPRRRPARRRSESDRVRESDRARRGVCDRRLSGAAERLLRKPGASSSTRRSRPVCPSSSATPSAARPTCCASGESGYVYPLGDVDGAGHGARAHPSAQGRPDTTGGRRAAPLVERFELRRDDDGLGSRLPFGDSPLAGTGARLDRRAAANRRHLRADGHRRRARTDDLRGAARAARSGHGGARHRERLGELPDHAAGRGEWRELVGGAILVPAERGGASRRRSSCRMLVEIVRVSADLLQVSRRVRPTHVLVPDFEAVLRESSGAGVAPARAACASSPGWAPRRRRAASTATSGAASSTRSSIASSPTRDFTRRELLAHGHPLRTRSRRLKTWRRAGVHRRTDGGERCRPRDFRRPDHPRQGARPAASTRSRCSARRGVDATLDVVGRHRRLGSAGVSRPSRRACATARSRPDLAGAVQLPRLPRRRARCCSRARACTAARAGPSSARVRHRRARGEALRACRRS